MTAVIKYFVNSQALGNFSQNLIQQLTFPATTLCFRFCKLVTCCLGSLCAHFKCYSRPYCYRRTRNLLATQRTYWKVSRDSIYIILDSLFDLNYLSEFYSTFYLFLFEICLIFFLTNVFLFLFSGKISSKQDGNHLHGMKNSKCWKIWIFLETTLVQLKSVIDHSSSLFSPGPCKTIRLAFVQPWNRYQDAQTLRVVEHASAMQSLCQSTCEKRTFWRVISVG